jgi:hypothetical protein
MHRLVHSGGGNADGHDRFSEHAVERKHPIQRSLKARGGVPERADHSRHPVRNNQIPHDNIG